MEEWHDALSSGFASVLNNTQKRSNEMIKLKKMNYWSLKFFYTLEYPEHIPAWQQHYNFCIGFMAVRKDRFFSKHSSPYHMLLCAICINEHICRGIDRPIG